MDYFDDFKLSDEIIMEWIKWLSYTPDFIKRKIKKACAKRAGSLSINELIQIVKYKESKEMLKLFNKYNLNICTKEERIRVNSFVENHNIEDIMNDKLSIDELKFIKEKINELKNLPYETLSLTNFNQNKENYFNLSMMDAYILHYLSKINFEKSIEDLSQKICDEINLRNIN